MIIFIFLYDYIIIKYLNLFVCLLIEILKEEKIRELNQLDVLMKREIL